MGQINNEFNFDAHFYAWPQPAHTPNGQILFEHTSSLFAWYVTRDPFPQDHAETRKNLAVIMRIAQASLDGGHFMSKSEESFAFDALSMVREKLGDGVISRTEIPKMLAKVIQELTEKNPKAKIIAQATQLEYAFCIHPVSPLSPKQTVYCRNLLNQMTSRVTPQLSESYAYAVVQRLSKILECSLSADLATKELQETIKQWM